MKLADMHRLDRCVRKDVWVRIPPLLLKIWTRLRGLWVKEIPEPPKPIRRKVDTNAIRARIQGLGWHLKELPIRRTDPNNSAQKVLHWKLIAVKGEKSFEVGGTNLDEAMQTIGQTLGVIPRKV
jgi:hypothetical protein